MNTVAGRELPPPDRPGSDRPRLAWLTARRAAPLWLLLGTLLQLVRGPGVPAWAVVFGEDGGIFLTEALASPGWGSLLTPYQGYVQLAPRLLAEGTAMLSLSAAAVSLSLSAALAVCLLSLFIYHASGALLRGRWARLAVAVVPVLLPAGAEINASITNLHWYLDYACFWALASALRRPRMVAAAAPVAALAVLSDPLAGLFLPLAGWRGWRALGLTRAWPSRGGRLGPVRWVELLVPAAFALAGVLQLGLGAVQQRPDRFLPSYWSDLPGIYGLRVAGSFLLGDRYLLELFGRLGLPFALLCLTVVAGGLAVGVRRRQSRPLILLAAALSVLWLVVPLMLRGTETFLDPAQSELPGSRYMLVPVLLLTVCAVAWVDSLPRARALSSQVAATLAFVVIAGLSWSIPSQRSDGPVWSATLIDAQNRCGQPGGAPVEVGRSAEAPWGLPAQPGHVLVPVAPAGPQPAWSVLVDCRRFGPTQG